MWTKNLRSEQSEELRENKDEQTDSRGGREGWDRNGLESAKNLRAYRHHSSGDQSIRGPARGRQAPGPRGPTREYQ